MKMATKLCDIEQGQSDLIVVARVCRLWRGKLLFDVERQNGLHCVLVDRNGNAIQGTVNETDYEEVVDKLKFGVIYEITHFHAVENQKEHKIVLHAAKLMFNNRTVFVQQPEVYPPYPRYWFQFLEYGGLRDRLGDDTILTDVIGRVHSVYGVEDVPMDKRTAPKRSVDIQNLRGEILTVNLWGNIGTEFDIAAIQRELYPVVIVFAGTKVRTFSSKINISTGMSTCIFLNPSIPETEEFKRRFVGPEYAPKMMTSVPKRMGRPAVDISTVNVMSIKSLNSNQSTPGKARKENEEKSFFIRGKITKIMCHRDWYYMGCPTCLRQMRHLDSSEVLKCDKDEKAVAQHMYKLHIRIEDETDSATVLVIGRSGDSLFGVSCEEAFNEVREMAENSAPPSLMRLMDETRLMEVVYGKRNDFVIKSVHQDDNAVAAQPFNVNTPEKPPAKRYYRNRADMAAKASISQEATKKQKGQSAQAKQLKKKQVLMQEQDTDAEESSEQENAVEEMSEDDGDCTLSQLYNQRLFEKKEGGQKAKALVIEKKAKSGASDSPVVGKKLSERIRNKNKAKME